MIEKTNDPEVDALAVLFESTPTEQLVHLAGGTGDYIDKVLLWPAANGEPLDLRRVGILSSVVRLASTIVFDRFEIKPEMPSDEVFAAIEAVLAEKAVS